MKKVLNALLVTLLLASLLVGVIQIGGKYFKDSNNISSAGQIRGLEIDS